MCHEKEDGWGVGTDTPVKWRDEKARELGSSGFCGKGDENLENQAIT